MIKVAWIIDGKNWNWDTRAAKLASLLPQYEHFFVANDCNPRITVAEAEALNADIVVCNPVPLLPFFKRRDNIVSVLSGMRILGQPCLK